MRAAPSCPPGQQMVFAGGRPACLSLRWNPLMMAISHSRGQCDAGQLAGWLCVCVGGGLWHWQQPNRLLESFEAADIGVTCFVLQMITAYQRENQLFCVRAIYQPNDPNNLQVRPVCLCRVHPCMLVDCPS